MKVVITPCTNLESLPLPFVNYPSHYGSFISFSNEESNKKYICECSKESYENFLNSKSTESCNSHNDNIDFLPNICHICNKRVPELNYCIPMYGSKFIQKYGWYVGAEVYKHGLIPISFERFREIKLPDEIEEYLYIYREADRNKNKYFSSNHENSKDAAADYINNSKLSSKFHRKVSNYFENIVRDRVGVKRVGQAWINETLLFNMLKTLLPNYTVTHHYRSSWLQQLEVDIFISEMNTAIEYQGIQHFKSIKAWGGDDALIKTQKRDRIKKELCKKNNVRIIYFY